jgi:hypothetical protein
LQSIVLSAAIVKNVQSANFAENARANGKIPGGRPNRGLVKLSRTKALKNFLAKAWQFRQM